MKLKLAWGLCVIGVCVLVLGCAFIVHGFSIDSFVPLLSFKVRNEVLLGFALLLASAWLVDIAHDVAFGGHRNWP